MFKILIAILFFVSNSSFAEEYTRLYGPIDKIYSQESAKNLRLFSRFAEKGVSVEDLSGENAFVEIYLDTFFSLHKFHHTIYVPPEFRDQIKVGRILKVDRYAKNLAVLEVVPEEHATSYRCPIDSPLKGISDCVIESEDAVSKITVK